MGRRWTWVAWSILTLSIVPVGAGLLVAEGNAAVILRGEAAERLDLSQEILARLAAQARLDDLSLSASDVIRLAVTCLHDQLSEKELRRR